jgi:diaminopimelate epimerase
MKQHLHFIKYHGLGNDFILVDGINHRVDTELLQKESAWICNRNFGIGADGIIVATESKTCDIKMHIINSDGSIAAMCGNGLRCFAQFCFEQGLIEQEVFSVETDAGKMVPALIIKNSEVIAVEVDMGINQYDSKIMTEKKDVNYKTITFEGEEIELAIVSMGNPHAVIFRETLDVNLLDKLGPFLQTHKFFPGGVNVEMVISVSSSMLELIVYERGAGKTLACATGACAAVVAGVDKGYCDRKTTVCLPGGKLLINWQESDNHIIQIGPTKHVFKGELVL